MRWIRVATVLLAAIGCAAAAGPEAAPAFGPQTFERTTGESDVYEESFELAESGRYVLFLRNGDAESSRVASAAVTLNGAAIVTAADLNEETPGVRREVELLAGSNELEIELNGQPGSFVTLALAAPGRPPIFVLGRLVLPWGRNDAERTLVLALKNGSPHAPRAFRALFFAPDGRPVAASERLTLPPRGSVAIPVEELIGGGSWEVGSIEIFYAGPGTSRMFGSSRQIDTVHGFAEVDSLVPGGQHVFRGRPDPAEHGPQRRLAR